LGCTSASDVRYHFTQRTERGLEITDIIVATMVVTEKKRPILAHADIAYPVEYVCRFVECESWYVSTATSTATAEAMNSSCERII
jgi:hypothetical protein